MNNTIPVKLLKNAHLSTRTEIYSYLPLKKGRSDFSNSFLALTSQARFHVGFTMFRLKHRQDEIGNSSPMLWIDVICINQDDLAERRQQISMMCKLYSHCSRLIVWLGIEDEASNTAINLLKVTARVKKEGAEVLKAWQNTLAAKYFESGGNLYIPLAKFFSRAWFSRAWVVQEYALGFMTDTVFKCGRLQLSSKDMRVLVDLNGADWPVTNTARNPKTIPKPSGFDGSMISVIHLLTSQPHFAAVATNRHTTNLLFWLTKLRVAEATDPRDKIYAILGLAESCGRNGGSKTYDVDSLIVDYAQPIQDVYSSLVKSLVIATKRVDVLIACCQTSRHVNRSWTPDWSIPGIPFGFCSRACGSESKTLKKEMFSCSGMRDAAVTFASDLSTMTVRGLVWDTVATFTPNDGGAADVVANEIINLFQTNWRNISINKTFSSERDCLQRIWQTMLLDGNADVDDLRPEDDFIDLGLNGISDPVTKTLRSEASDGALLLHTPKLLEECTRLDLYEDWSRLFLTSENFIGKDFSGELQPGDLICVLLGCHIPVALRRVGSHYEFIRSVYLDGIMFREALEALERGEVKLENFELH
ncbi:HET-domain-containing protein [Stipitochalara longipes BDJ]|nr:HET-domain-containing protein [Stipitochalara longipes BDJ]